MKESIITYSLITYELINKVSQLLISRIGLHSDRAREPAGRAAIGE
jgi:hypothetical protein